MKRRQISPVFAGLAALLLFTSCPSVSTGGDDTPPIIEVRALHGPNDAKLYRTTREGVKIKGLGCANGDFSGAYVTDLSSGSMDFSVTSLDPGGTRELNLTINPVKAEDVVDIECVTCFGEEPEIEIEQVEPLKVVVSTKLGGLTPRNMHVLTFTVTGLDRLLTMNVEAIDLNGNQALLAGDGTSFYYADIVDDGECTASP